MEGLLSMGPTRLVSSDHQFWLIWSIYLAANSLGASIALNIVALQSVSAGTENTLGAGTHVEEALS